MNLIIALIIGGIIGWLASIVMRTDAQQGILLNIVVGIIGSLLGGFLLGPLLGGGNLLSGAFDIMTLIVALLGALILLAIVNLFRSEEHTSELQSLMRHSYDGFCFKKKKKLNTHSTIPDTHYINTHLSI